MANLGGSTARTVLILGVRRSGTSLTASIVQKLGVHFENNHRPPDEFNKRGYWESSELSRINIDLLSFVGGTDGAIPFTPIGWENDSKLDLLYAEGRKLIERYDSAHPIWGWKDPRLSVTLPFWIRLLDRDAAHIICVRNPLEVAESWLAMNPKVKARTTVRHATSLWFAYMASAIKNTSGKRRLFVFYDSLMSKPAHETQNIASFIGKETTPGSVEAIEGDLRHHKVLREQMISKPDISSEAKMLYTLLEELDPNGDDSTIFDGVFKDYEGSPLSKSSWRVVARRYGKKILP